MLTSVIFFIDYAARLVLAVYIVMRRRPVAASLAWLAVILFVPLVGLPLYLLVGETRLGSRRIRKYNQRSADFEARAAAIWRARSHDWPSDAGPYSSVARLNMAVGGTPPLRGNELRLIGASDEFIKALIADIDQAKRSCHLLFYIWMPTGAGERVAEAVIRAARRGVDCRVLVDDVGSRPFLRCPIPRAMRDAGVRVEAALCARLWRVALKRLDLRNHRKIVVIDGWIAYAGSQNVTDATFGVNARRRIGPWIDSMVRIQGPAAQALQIIFLRDWQLESDDLPPHIEQVLPELPIAEGGSAVQVVATGPGPSPTGLHESFLTIIYAARDELLMVTPYFVPDEATLTALISAARRGVAAALVIPERIDARVVEAAGRSHYAELLQAGVRIFHHQRGLLHSKMLTVDRSFALVGSANFDMRSFWLNFEVSLLIFDPNVAQHVRAMQMHYLSESEELKYDTWTRRPLLRRAWENTCRLLGPLL